MTEKYITYKVNGEKYNIPESLTSGFEKKYPSATIEMHVGDDIYNIPPKHKDGFLSKYSDASYAFEMNDAKQEEENPQPTFMQPEEESSSIADIINDPSLSRRERKKAIKEAKKNGEMPNTIETTGKAVGAIGTSIGKMAVDVSNLGLKMSRLQNPAIGFADMVELKTGVPVPEELVRPEQVFLDKASEKLQNVTEDLSKGADPTGGEIGFGELLKKGHIGLAMQKAWGSTLESAPMMIATKTPIGALIYGVGMAASNYADETRENPDIPAWKRAINSVGSAALELAVEKMVDIPWKYFGNAGGEITDEFANEVIERVAEEGAQTIAKRIKRALGNTAKDAIGEGFEEVITSLGNDSLGSALDAIDGNKDYGFKAQWNEFKEQNPDATVDDFANAKGREYVESFLGGALSSIYMSGLGNVAKEAREARARNNFDNAYMYGSSLDYKDMYDTNDDVNTAIESAMSASTNQNGEETLTRGFIENLSAEEAFALSRSEEVKPELRNALGELAVQKAKQDGLTGKLDDRVASSISEMTDIIEQASDNDTITSGVYGDKVVFVKGGVVNADGTISLPNGQSGPVIVFDGNNKYTVDSSEISGAWSTGKDGYIQSAESSIRDLDAFRREEFANIMGPRAKANAVKQYLNTKILINTEEGAMTQVEVQAILPDGQVLVKGKKGDLGGQSERLFGPSEFYDAIARNEDGSPVFVENLSQQSTQTPAENTQGMSEQSVVPAETQDYRDSEQTILINGIPTTVEVTNQDDSADRVTYTYTDENGARRTGSTTVAGFADAIKQAEEEMTVEIPAETLNQEENVESPVVPETPAAPETTAVESPDVVVNPKDKEEEVQLEPEDINWDALFEQDPEAYFAELQKQFGDGAAEVLNMEIAATQKELDKLEKNQGATRTERIKNLQKIARLRLEKGTLEEMANRLQSKNEPITETSEVVESEQVATPEVAATEPITESNATLPEPELVEPAKVEKDPEPRNAVEFAARELGLRDGGIKLLWESFKHHTGYGNVERSKFLGLFRTKEKGGMTLEEAGERLMELDREYGTGFFDQNDPNAGLDAILTAISSNGTMGELRSYTRRQHESDAQREADEINAFIMNAHNEALLDDEVTLEDVAEKDLTEDEYNELITKFAEEIYDYEESNKRDALAVSEAEEIGDLPLATGETVRGGEGSNSVLQETQPIQTRGEGTLDEESEGVDERINREDADSPVYSGEPSVSEGVYPESESVSSLDEDMPDFTGESERIPVAPNQVADPIAEAKKIEKHLATQLERDLSKEQKQDLAKSLGKKVADLFATREAYDEYQETATDFGAYNSYFDEGVEDSFAKRQNQQQISNENLSVTSEAQQLTVDALKEALDGYIDTEIVSDEQAQAMLDVRDELSNIEAMTVYHGSGAKFESFDHSHMGEGEGAQAHGWGTYVAVDSKTSEAYAESLRSKKTILMNGSDVTYLSDESWGITKSPKAYLVGRLLDLGSKTRDYLVAQAKLYRDWYNTSTNPIDKKTTLEMAQMVEAAIELYDNNTWSIEGGVAHLYNVEIPEDNGDNYFDEENPTKNQIQKLYNACVAAGIEYAYVIEGETLLDTRPVGKKITSNLSKILGSSKAASEFMAKAGFVGIKYHGRFDGDCFVIFNEADAKITGTTEFYQTPNGTVYGWTDGKKIYLTKAGINPNTPIHEYTHLWAKAMMQKNPKGWNRIKQLLKGTPVWNEVMNDANYSDIHGNEDAVASEVLSRISGSENAAKMERMAKKMIDEAKGTARKLEARGLIQNMKDALNMFWEFVWKDLFKMTYFRDVEHVTDRVLFDLLNQTDLGELSEGQVETQIRKDGESPRQFVQNVVSNEKFNNPAIGKIEVADVTPETAKKFGYTFEELQNTASHYNAKSGLITIFAHEDEDDSDLVRTDIYHEVVHRVAKTHPEIVKIGKLFWDYAESVEDFEIIKHKIEEKYKESAWHEEMLCEIFSIAIVGNFADTLKDSLPESYRKDIELVLKETGYDKERKSVRFSWTNTEKTKGLESSSEGDVRARQQTDIRENGGNPKSEEIGISESSDIHSRRSDIQNASVSFLVGPQRNGVIERAVNEEAAKIGVTVTYKTREEMPAGHKNDKGYYNPQTGEIVVCTENATSIADAIKTILHEAVAHKGLRKLFGNRFDEFIRNVYDLLDAETKAKVDARAAAHYNGDTAVAMEEYMASLAENENFADQTIWDKIKSIFTNLINDILGRNDIKIGDNELRYILRASYNNMVNPRSMDTIEGWAKDQLMREEYKVNESTPEILSRTGIDDIAFTTAREAYETVTFNGFTEIMKAIQSATGFKGKVKAIKTGLLKIWNEVQMENQDAQQAVIAGIEAIQKETGNIPVEDFENYLMAENQSQSRSAEEIESFLQNYFAPIVDHINTIITAVMKARGLNPKNKKKRAEIYAEVRNYMIAKHGLERNAYYQTTTGDMRDYSGLTALFGLPDTEFALAETLAQDMVDKFENEIGDAARDALWDKINAATNKTLRHSYECGLLSRSQYDKIKDMFDFYIPLRGFDETTAEDVYSYARFDGNRFQPAVREAHGRTSLAFDPISVIMNMAQSEIVQGNKNRVKQALYNFVGNRPNSLLTRRDCWYVLNRATGVWEEAYPDIANVETWDNFETRMQALEATGDAQKMKKGLDIGYRFQKPANKDEHYIHLKINGVEHAIYVNGNQRLAEGVNGFNRNTPNILDSIKKVNRAASQLFTNYSYKFGGKNFLRDFIWAQTVMRIKESPLYRLRFAGNWMVNNPITIGVLMKKYRDGTLDMSNNNHRLFKEFIENGGKTGYVFIDELEKQKSRIDKAIERMAKNGNTKTNNATKAALLLNIIQYVNECIELAARFGTYVTSRNTKDKSGNVRSITQSIDDAKGITTNFNRKGAQSGRGLIGGLANFMGSWNFFYNAAVQGVQQIKKLNDEHPIKAKVVIGGWIGLGFALPFILDIFRGDDDDDEIYWNIPEYERKNNICIPLGKGKVTLTIPLSPTIREAYAIGVTINDAIFNKSVDKDATMLSMECASLLAKALIPANPVEGLSAGLTPAENLIMFGTPDIADPIVEAVINKDWTGAPIEYKTSYNEGAPHYTKVVGKNDWKEKVGEKLYKLGEDNLGSSLDINLSAWEHVITSSTGGIGTMMKDISNIAEWVMGTETPERLNDIPVARTLFSSSAMDDEKFVNNIYWDMNDVYKKKTKTLSSVYGLTEKEAFAEQEGKGESNLVKVYEAKSYPFLKRYYELNKELSTMQKNIDKMPTETQSDKNEKVLAEQELFNKKRDMVYELLEYEIE